MQIVIDIPKDTYVEIMGFAENSPRELNYYERRIAEGIQLPEEYGDLIDANEYLKDIRSHYFDNKTVLRCTEIALQNADVVIPAKKGETT